MQGWMEEGWMESRREKGQEVIGPSGASRAQADSAVHVRSCPGGKCVGVEWVGESVK